MYTFSIGIRILEKKITILAGLYHQKVGEIVKLGMIGLLIYMIPFPRPVVQENHVC